MKVTRRGKMGGGARERRQERKVGWWDSEVAGRRNGARIKRALIKDHRGKASWWRDGETRWRWREKEVRGEVS